ncbi:MAG: DUF349 domain-containing protein [Maribacter sp.]
MPEDKEPELQEQVVEKVDIDATEEASSTIEETIDGPKVEATPKAEKLEASKEENSTENDEAIEDVEKVEVDESKVQDETTPTSQNSEDATSTENNEVTEEKTIEEIDDNNAEDAEDSDNHHRHKIPILDYHSMSIENLTGELQKLVKNEKVQAIKKHVDGIKNEFDLKFQEFIDQKKEDFIAKGGNEIDFRYNSVTKKQFNEVYSEYRDNRNQYYKNLEKNLKDNLAIRLELIDRLKGFINVEEDINTTYKNFKNLQEEWRNAGPIPRTDYNNVWKTYHHHIEIFYDFLNINRELRDLDFKHNLEEKQKLVVKADALANEPDLGKAFRELQMLHKIWKEDIGPVGKEHREQIWELFSSATKVLHNRRQDYYKDLDKVHEQNLVKKQEIIAAIIAISEDVSDNHKALQLQMKKIEEQRDAFFKAGKVPQKVNEKTWAEFKDAVRKFNRNKNAFYKNLKKDQQVNLDKKRALLNAAISLKDSDDWEVATQEMKRVQSEWKQIGHVPRKYSDKIWKEFKSACNHYFDRLHALKNEAHKEESENLTKKESCLERLREFKLSGKREDDLSTVKDFIKEWKGLGRVPFNKKNIDQKFNKILDAIFKKMDVSRQESELLKYGNKIQQLSKGDDNRAISNERTFIRRKIDESKNEIRQLENNLQFFSNASGDNPLVQDVIKRVEIHKQSLETWKEKLKKLNIMENNLHKEAEADAEAVITSEEE